MYRYNPTNLATNLPNEKKTSYVKNERKAEMIKRLRFLFLCQKILGLFLVIGGIVSCVVSIGEDNTGQALIIVIGLMLCLSKSLILFNGGR